MGIMDRMKNAWNAFSHEDNNFNNTPIHSENVTYGSWAPQFRVNQYSKGSIIDMIIARIAIDVSMVEFKHVRIDNDPKTEVEIKDGLNYCLTEEANIDQSNIDFIQDIVFSMMDEGVVAVVPIDTDVDPDSGSFDVISLRTGRIVQWYPLHVRVRCYDDRSGTFKELLVPKHKCAIIPNPLYAIVNGENSTLKRLVKKLQIMDIQDEKITSNKLNVLIKLPYVTNNEIKKERAKDRIKAIQDQLVNNPYGIAYIDQNEDVTTLGGTVENDLLNEIKYLQEQLFNQLGLTNKVFDGSASEQELRSYYDRTITPISRIIAKELERKFLTKTARTQGHSITYFTDPFKLVPLSQLATMADTLIRNAILTSNEFRSKIGFQPADDARANELYNPNIADSNQMMMQPGMEAGVDGQQMSGIDFEGLISNLGDDQIQALIDKAREILGNDSVPDDQIFNTMSEDQMAQLVEFINTELIGEEGE